jgi:regulator of PEP synthase PpsR (kinase-PPPase family)
MQTNLARPNGDNGATTPAAVIFVVSGGAGASGDHLVRTVLAQFGRVDVVIEVIPHVCTRAQVDEVVKRVAAAGGVLVHTMVNAALRQELESRAEAAGVLTIDLMGPLLCHLETLLQRSAVGEPGLYRRLNRHYFERIEAMEFTLTHDDGERPDDLPQAQIVLVGVSRVGKTPISVYLSLIGWKVANMPLVPGVEPPPQFFQVDRHRMVGLIIEPLQLRVHRRRREQRMGVTVEDYVDLEKIGEEIRQAQRFFYRHGIAVVDVTNKPIESIADEVVALIV